MRTAPNRLPSPGAIPEITRAPSRAFPVAASSLLRPLVEGPPRRLVVAASSALVMHLSTGDQRVPLLSVVPIDGVRLPGAVVMAGRGGNEWSTVCRAGAEVDGLTVGGGRVCLGGVDLVPRRWWGGTTVSGLTMVEPRMALVALGKALVEPPTAQIARPADAATGAATAAFVEALASMMSTHSGDDVEAAVDALVGLGPGLTPAGDDVLVGALLAWHALAPGRPAVALVRARVAVAVGRSIATSARTTAVSAALLSHAIRGEGMPAVVQLVHALGDPTQVRAAVAEVVGIGHDSGSSMLRGVRLATRFACRSSLRHDPGMLVG